MLAHDAAHDLLVEAAGVEPALDADLARHHLGRLGAMLEIVDRRRARVALVARLAPGAEADGAERAGADGAGLVAVAAVAGADQRRAGAVAVVQVGALQASQDLMRAVAEGARAAEHRAHLRARVVAQDADDAGVAGERARRRQALLARHRAGQLERAGAMHRRCLAQAPRRAGAGGAGRAGGSSGGLMTKRA